MNKNIVIVILVILLAVAGFFLIRGNNEGAPSLTEDIAKSLVIEEWGTCEGEDGVWCSEFSVELDKQDGSWQVTATYTGIHDDSSGSSRHVALAYYQNGTWTLGERTTTWKCHPGRGHQDFSTENCS